MNKIELRYYQREAVDAIFKYFQHSTGNPLVVLPTGAGKSLTMAAFIHEAIQAYPSTRVLLLTHVKELIEQDAQAIINYWHEAPVGIWSASVGQKQKQQITVAGIQSIHRLPAKFADTDLIIVDEAHLIPRSGGTMYRKFLDALLKYNPAVKVIGLTATEYRTDSGLLVEGDERVFTDVAYSINVGRLIKEGYLCPLVMKGGATKADLSNVHVRGNEYIPAEAQKAMDHDHLIEGALTEVAQFAADRKHILGFCAGVEHAYHCMQKARERGWTANYVHGAMSSTERDMIINSFKQGKIRFLFNANILTTGFDFTAIDCIIMLRPTKSTGLYCLDDKTEILTSQGWKAIGEVNAGDCVPSLNMETGKGQWAGVLSSIERETYAEENFVSYVAPRADFRVTDNHNMLFCTTNEWEPHAPQYRLDTAANMASFADGVRVPTAVEIDQPGVPLTDAEIYFIGMMLTDGTWSAFQAGISQSERHPEIIDRIEKCLTDCGLLWKKRKIKAKTQFNERYPRWTYSISAGKPRNGVDGSGFRHLMPYMDKDFSQSLLSLSRRQFVVLMKAINDGDGFKVEKSPGCDWTPRSWTICSARKIFVDRLQALASIHGFTGNLRYEQGKSRKNPIYILTVTPQAWRSIGGSGQRPQMTTSPAGKERVWCVETETGTIITRRNGKVTVMGNCQIMGRGLRKHKDKENTLVLDFVGAVATHGPIDAIVVKSKRKKGEATIGVAPVKECPKCNELIHASVMLCPGCGYEFPASAVHGTEAADGVIVAALAKPQLYKVDSVNYCLHMKDGRKSLKVEYWCGLKTFTEFLPVEDPRSFVRKHAVAWFWKRGCTCPDSVDEALKMSDEKRIPATKSVTVKMEGKYFRVIDAEIEFESLEATA